jgi:virulence factor
MLKIGIIGLGDIAQKAYLPVISKRKVECHLFTRHEATLSHLAGLYRYAHTHSSMESLIKSGIKAAFVHSSTASHYSIVEQLLSNNIHVYVDKPLTYDYKSSEILLDLAERKGLILFVGFNRRYAPAYQQLKALPDANMVIMQKNRKSMPADIRTFIFDDFIHVIDTLLFCFPHPIEKIKVTGKKDGDLLYYVVIQLTSPNGVTAIGVMNRDSGTTEETLEVFTPREKRVVHNVSDVCIHRDGQITKIAADDWSPTLLKRGFEDIVDDFLSAVESGSVAKITKDELLLTHKICEEVVEKLNGV